MARTGRKIKLNDKLQTDLRDCIARGVTVEDSCAHVGLSTSAFYEWMQRGRKGDPLFTDFVDAIDRARGEAKVTAIETLRTAMQPYNQTQTVTETFTETRLDRDGNPYDYVRTMTRKTVTRFQGDWRAAVEYLKRRYPEEWSEHLEIHDNRWREQAISDIRAGIVTYEQLAEAFDDSIATDLFTAARVSIPAGATAGDAQPGASKHRLH